MGFNFVPEERIELSWCYPRDFESRASAYSATRAIFFKNSFPQPDFKKISLFLDSFLLLNCSINMTSNGKYGLVVLL